MPPQNQVPRLFIGSSSEGMHVARNLQAELGSSCEIERWDQGGVFEPSGYTLDSLLSIAKTVDFAVLIATADDKITSRGSTQDTMRDNILLEFGLFAGVLGRERTYLLAAGDLKLPTDVLGLTRLPYHDHSNPRAAVNSAALALEQQFKARGCRDPDIRATRGDSQQQALDRELSLLCHNAATQGWTVKTNSQTTLRLRSPQGRTFTLSKQQPEETRRDLRTFVAQLRGSGLRVNASIRRQANDSNLER